MTPPATAARSTTDRPPSPEAVLLEALAAAGESLTYAIVHHDLDAIVAATRDAEVLMAELAARDKARKEAARLAVAEFAGVDADVDADRGEDGEPVAHPELEPPDPAVLLLGARIGAAARRNAILLEHAWATDAALLRMLAAAAREEAASSALATGYAPVVHEPQPAGWLDRSA